MKTEIPERWIVEQKIAEDRRCAQILREAIVTQNAEIKELNRYIKEHEADRYTKIRLGGLKKSRREMKRRLKELEGSLAG